MDKQPILNTILNKLVDSSLINCCYTDEVILDNVDLNINFYVMTSIEKVKLLKDFLNTLFKGDSNLIHIRSEENNNSYYFENGVIVNIFINTNNEVTILGKICPLFDPTKILENYLSKGYTYTNLEYAQTFDKLSCALIDFYNSCKKGDKFDAYDKSLKIEKIFISLYRAFYDSINAKLNFTNINKTMNPKFILPLNEIIKAYTFDSFLDAVIYSIKEIDKILAVLSINVVTLFNFDFYNYAKQLINSLN